MNQAKIKATVILLAGIILALLGARFFKSQYKLPNAVKANSAKTQGNIRAELKVVEYTDFQCPACAKGSQVLKEYLKVFPNRIFLEYHHYPLDMHPQALPIAIAAQCAAKQKKFWPFHDLAFTRQNLLRESINLPGRLQELAQESGLNRKAFDACVADPAVKAEVLAEKKQGTDQQVKATPTYFINGKMVVGSNALSDELGKRLQPIPKF